MLKEETKSPSCKQLRPAGENTHNEVNQNKMTRLTNSIPSQNIYQGDCNLEEMMWDTSNRFESKDNVISSFEQLTKEENGSNANAIFHDTLKGIPKLS